MSASTLLARLDRVLPAGPGRWIARCPAHEDRSPSLAIRELDDGRVLLHDFGGCATHDVLAAVGLTFADVMPERLGHNLPRERRPFDAYSILQAIAYEALVVSLAAGRIIHDGQLDDDTYDRLLVAVARLQVAAEVARGR